jgi:creatinine amidohydrolase
MREVRWERMFPDELEAAFQEFPVVYLPYGLCEPHGPQNTLGLDALKAHGICRKAAQNSGGIVAPPDYWHIHEIGAYAHWAEKCIGEARPWLTAVPPWLHFKNVCYHLRAVDALGFHAAILLTGHYGPNWVDLKTFIEILQPHFAMRIYGLPDFEANTPGFEGTGSGGDHAGKVETSLLWALEPDCVDFSRLPPEHEPGMHFAMGTDARRSKRRAGEQMVEDEVRWLSDKAQAMLADYAALGLIERAPISFERMERIWAEEVQPRLKAFATMQPPGDPNRPEPSPGSRWKLNWDIPDLF